jgi:hypothetical protein
VAEDPCVVWKKMECKKRLGWWRGNLARRQGTLLVRRISGLAIVHGFSYQGWLGSVSVVGKHVPPGRRCSREAVLGAGEAANDNVSAPHQEVPSHTHPHLTISRHFSHHIRFTAGIEFRIMKLN